MLCCDNLLGFIILLVVFYLILRIYNKQISCEENFETDYIYKPPTYSEQDFLTGDTRYMLFEGKLNDKIAHNFKCDKFCCGAQWVPPGNMPYEALMAANHENLIPTNLTCAGTQENAGCLCVPKEYGTYMSRRALNS